MPLPRAAAAAAVSVAIALGTAGAALRAAGERGVAVAEEGALGFLEGALMMPVLAAAVFALIRAVRGPEGPRAWERRA